MTKFFSKSYDGTLGEFIWDMAPGQYPLSNQSSVDIHEYTLRSAQMPLGGTFTIHVLEYETEVKILHQSRDYMPAVTGKGLTAGMLMELFRIYKGKRIISSSRRPTDILGESRSREMDKVYLRLHSAGIVQYDDDRDIYVYELGQHQINLKTLDV